MKQIRSFAVRSLHGVTGDTNGLLIFHRWYNFPSRIFSGMLFCSMKMKMKMKLNILLILVFAMSVRGQKCGNCPSGQVCRSVPPSCGQCRMASFRCVDESQFGKCGYMDMKGTCPSGQQCTQAKSLCSSGSRPGGKCTKKWECKLSTKTIKPKPSPTPKSPEETHETWETTVTITITEDFMSHSTQSPNPPPK